MPLTPLDIQNKEFRRSFRGYHETEVDEFLDEVVREMEALVKDNAALKEQVETLSARLEQYRQLEDTLHNALLVAQETAEEVKASARKEADLLVREARQEADSAQADARRRVEEAEALYLQMMERVRVFRSQVRGMLVSHLDLLEKEEKALSETAGSPGAQAAVTAEISSRRADHTRTLVDRARDSLEEESGSENQDDDAGSGNPAGDEAGDERREVKAGGAGGRG